MRNKSRTIRLFFMANAVFVVTVLAYKVYLNFFEQDFSSVHAQQVERIETALAGKDAYRFAVVGNINNSVGIFERKIIPMLNRSGVDFIVSAGNAVSSGGEDKYRALYRTLGWLQVPYLLSFGENENSRLGGFRFYDHFGPYLFSFSAGNSRFVFLDSTGKTDYQWQLRWLEEDLAASATEHVFVFSGHPMKPIVEPRPWDFGGDYLFDESVRQRFTQLIEGAQVNAVFSANLPLYSDQHHHNTHYVLTGGAGGFVPESEHSFYHYVEVSVNEGYISISPVRLDIAQHAFWRTLESLWFFIHSIFYVGYLNFLLLLSVFIVAGMWLHSLIFIERDYYPNLDLDPAAYLKTPLRVAMFTNNFLPFIGGVPIAIERLRRGLRQLGHEVLVVAPCYRQEVDGETHTVRVGSLLPIGKLSEFRLANIFSWRLYRQALQFRPQIIHVHHPFWLGSAGIVVARLLNVPVLYSYHTRLEHYAHYVPLPGPLFRNLVSHALVRRFANRCDGIVVPTESAEEYLRTIGVKRPIFVQPTGIDYDSFQQVEDAELAQLRSQLQLNGKKVLISVSRLSKEKNLDFLLDAVARLARTCTEPFHLLLLGEGEEREHLQARIQGEGLEPWVSLVGAVNPERIPLYCRLGDIFLFASRSETQGMVILEAMAAGMPVVAVRSSGIDDFIEDGFNGYKTPLNRSRWCARVEQLLTDEQLRQRIAANAHSFAYAYRIDRFAANFTAIYARLLAAKAATRAPTKPASRH